MLAQTEETDEGRCKEKEDKEIENWTQPYVLLHNYSNAFVQKLESACEQGFVKHSTYVRLKGIFILQKA